MFKSPELMFIEALFERLMFDVAFVFVDVMCMPIGEFSDAPLAMFRLSCFEFMVE